MRISDWSSDVCSSDLWMLPATPRGDFYETADRMGFVMRRLLAGRMVGMAVEGIGTGIGLWIGGVPMAALLGIITGLLTFIPNIGEIGRASCRERVCKYV